MVSMSVKFVFPTRFFLPSFYWQMQYETYALPDRESERERRGRGWGAVGARIGLFIKQRVNRAAFILLNTDSCVYLSALCT